MTDLLAIDPGARSGLAWFHESGGVWRLLRAVVTSPNVLVPCRPDIVVIENPRIYPNSKARPNDILTLARLVGRYEERYPGEQHLVTPHEWKGSINGDIMTARIKAALTPQENAIASESNYDHNMLDAIGLGKWALRQPWMRGR